MTLILSNDDVARVLTMPDCLSVLEQAYRDLHAGDAVTRRRSDCLTPTVREDATYGFKTMDGVIPSQGVAAVRLNSDIVTWPTVDGNQRRVKIPAAPNTRWTGLILVFSTETGEPLAIMPDGVVQRFRVGATNGLGAKYMAREDAAVVGILGSGWQAGAQLLGLDAVHELDEIRIYSPNRNHCLIFAQEMSAKLGKTVRPCDSGEEACKGAHVVACATNSVMPVFFKQWMEPGMHLGSIRPAATEIEQSAWDEIDVLALLDHEDDPIMVYTHGVRVGEEEIGVGTGMAHDDFHAGLATLPQIMTGRREGRSDDGQITCFLNNLGLGYQFAAAGYVVNKKAREQGIGHELPTEWFTETVHP